MKISFGIIFHTVFLITCAICEDNKITQFIENEAKLMNLTMWEARTEVAKRFGVKFIRSCDPSSEACSAFPLMACIKTNDFHIILWSDLTGSFEEINTIIFRLDKPTMPCVNQKIRDIKTTMIGKTREEIVAQFGKPKHEMPCSAEDDGEYIYSPNSKEKLYSICYQYETGLWQEWSEQYQTNITRCDIIEFEFKNDRVISYSVHKGGE